MERQKKYHRARRAMLPFEVTVAQLFILWIVSAIRFDAESKLHCQAHAFTLSGTSGEGYGAFRANLFWLA